RRGRAWPRSREGTRESSLALLGVVLADAEHLDAVRERAERDPERCRGSGPLTARAPQRRDDQRDLVGPQLGLEVAAWGRGLGCDLRVRRIGAADAARQILRFDPLAARDHHGSL